ncbi:MULTISPECIES: endonuclease domain-containing protein [unclassified Kribbella]|uniref:endonuclease domain-containing protein n=1 Tax=unclassified Kribbella TaxID=2644121 RepID=UPI003019FD89
MAKRRKDLLAGGVTRAQLESERWVSPHFGYHRSAQVNDSVRQRILDAVAVMPSGGVVGGWASAYLQGVAYLDGGWGAVRGEVRVGEPVLLVVPPRSVVNRPGITTLRATLQPDDVVECNGVSCTTGTRTAYDLLRLAPDLTEAVVAGDCMLHAGLTDSSAISQYAGTHPGRRGIRRLRDALPLLNRMAASPPESRLRMLCRQAGLPPLEVNVPVFDVDGIFLGIVDLLEPVAGLGLEYDGAYHRDLGQHTADNHREEGLERNGLTIVRVTSLDLKNEETLLSRIRRAHQICLTTTSIAGRWTYRRRTA